MRPQADLKSDPSGSLDVLTTIGDVGSRNYREEGESWQREGEEPFLEGYHDSDRHGPHAINHR